MGKQSVDHNKPKHGVWLEFEPPRDKEHALEVCKLGTALLRKLGAAPGVELFLDERHMLYCYGGDMGYFTLTDHGHWFNLEYMARATS